jgi:hypothetical protein
VTVAPAVQGVEARCDEGAVAPVDRARALRVPCKTLTSLVTALSPQAANESVLVPSLKSVMLPVV